MPSTSSERPVSETPTASSVYSQPSPDLSRNTTSGSDTPRVFSHHYNDVSPPESIQMNDGGKNGSQRSSLDISPITESPSPLATYFKRGSRQGSSIPVPTKMYDQYSPRPLFSGWRGRGASASPPDRDSTVTNLTRWDDFSGEPTTSEAGKPAQAVPGAVNFEFEHIQGQRAGSLGNETSINGGRGQGGRRYSTKQPEPLFSPKEAWRGASGRHAIMNPLLDKPLPPGKTPSFPRGSQQHSVYPREHSSGSVSPASTVIYATQRKSSLPSRFIDSHDLVDHHESSGEDTPLDGPQIFPCYRHADSAIQDSILSHPTQHILTEEKKDRRVPVSPEATPRRVSGGQDLAVNEKDFRARMHHMHLEDQPPSRFSATTYATTAFDSPPATPLMNTDCSGPTPSSILNRKRPVPAAGIPSRKPTPSELGRSFNAGTVEGGLSKSLPKSPPEAQAVTRVASLEAKLDNLRRRRGNLGTVIHELTHVVQPSSIAYDMASRHEIKRTVDGLKKELEIVVKEEHETGLQLHRAWKRHDNDSAYENSSLWVKRLAS